MAGLLYHGLHSQSQWWDWPQDVRQELQQLFQAALAQELLRSHHLENILEIFATRGIPCILLKGEALARTHYAIPSIRARADCDLFIDIADIAKARQAVLDAGLNIVSPVYKSHQFTVRRTLKDLDVFEFDMHWRILNNPRYARVLDFAQAYANSLAAPGLEPARVLQPGDALLHACMHRVANAAHDCDRLIWTYDIHVLVAALTPRQLQDFAQRAVRRGVQAACLSGLMAARTCLHTQWPDAVTVALSRPAPEETWSRRFAESHLALLLDDWKHLSDGKARRAMLRELFLPPAESLASRYGHASRRWLPWLYVRHVLGGLSARLTLR